MYICICVYTYIYIYIYIYTLIYASRAPARLLCTSTLTSHFVYTGTIILYNIMLYVLHDSISWYDMYMCVYIYIYM